MKNKNKKRRMKWWTYSVNQVPCRIRFRTKARAEKAAKARVRADQARWGQMYGRYYTAGIKIF